MFRRSSAAHVRQRHLDGRVLTHLANSHKPNSLLHSMNVNFVSTLQRLDRQSVILSGVLTIIFLGIHTVNLLIYAKWRVASSYLALYSIFDDQLLGITKSETAAFILFVLLTFFCFYLLLQISRNRPRLRLLTLTLVGVIFICGSVPMFPETAFYPH